jgi:hypothetical protein
MKYSWASYTGWDAIVLALVLAVITAALIVIAVRKRNPTPGPVAGGGVTAILVVPWILAIVTFLVTMTAYIEQAHEVHFKLPSPANYVTPVTLSCAALTFLTVVVLTPARPRTRIANAFFAACAGPIIFELPFDLIVLSHTSAIPPAPSLYIELYFLPLFIIEFLTIGLAITRVGARFTRWTAIWLAGMFGVFMLWALIGFEYPWGGLPLTMNIVSKILAFAVVLSLFVRRENLAVVRARG